MLPIFRGFAHAISPHMTFFFKNGGRIFPWRHLAFFKVMANRDSLKNSGLFNMVGSRVLYALLYAKAVLRQLALSCHIIKAVCFLEFGLGLAYFLPVRIASSRQMIVRFSTQFRTTHPSANTGSSAKHDQGILHLVKSDKYHLVCTKYGPKI